MTDEIKTAPQHESDRPIAPPELVEFVRAHFSATCRVVDCDCDPRADVIPHESHLDLVLLNSDLGERLELGAIFDISGDHLMLSSCGPIDGAFPDDFCIRQIALGLNGSRPPVVYALGNYRDMDGTVIEIGPLIN